MIFVRSVFVLIFLAVSGWAHAQLECDSALVTTETYGLPAPIDPGARAPEVFRQMLEVIRRDPGVGGTTNAMTVLNGEVRPVVELVTSYLQARQNYPGGLSKDPKTELISILMRDINTRLEALQANRDVAITPRPMRWDWMRLRKVPVEIQPDGEILKIRYLHFALIYAARKLEADAKKWPEALRKATVFRKRMREVEALLDRVEALVNIETSDLTFKVRLKNFIDGIRNQKLLLEGVHDMIEQRIHWANATLDEVGTMLSMRLSLEAVMSAYPVDLSPLEPPNFSGPMTMNDGPAPSNPEMQANIRSIIESARNMTNFPGAREVLVRFLEANVRHLSVDQAIEIATCITTSDYTVNVILKRYVELRKMDLSQNDVLRLANACRGDKAKQDIIKYISMSGVAKLGARMEPPPPHRG